MTSDFLPIALAIDPLAPIVEHLTAQFRATTEAARQIVRDQIALIYPVLLSYSPLVFAGCAALITFLLLTSRALKGINKPDAPFLSPVVRSLARPVWVASVAALGAVLVLVSITFGALWFAEWLEIMGDRFLSFAHWLLFGVATGVVGALPLTLRTIPQWARGDGLPDVRELTNSLRTLKSIYPLRYIDIHRGCFIGLNLRRRPIYLPWQKLHETHVQVVGGTGSGKGVSLSLLAHQAILTGAPLMYFDPKADRFAPRILAQAAQQAGKKFRFLNLNADQPAQLDLLQGATEHEIEELLVAGFDLRARGGEADFYRGQDEDAAMESAALAASRGINSLPALFAACGATETITKREHFWREFRKLMRLPVLQTESGVSFKTWLEDGDVIYIVGSTDNERVVKLQKMILVRVMQVIKGRDRSRGVRNSFVIIDEFKFILSPPALGALAVVRDFGCTLLLAHQSLGDLRQCNGIDPAAVEGAVLDNTALKLVFRTGDADHAERLSRIAGQRRTHTDIAGKSNADDRGGWREAHTPLISPDLFLNLPVPADRNGQPVVGVVLGAGPANVFFSGHIPAEIEMPTVTPAPVFRGALAAEELI